MVLEGRSPCCCCTTMSELEQSAGPSVSEGHSHRPGKSAPPSSATLRRRLTHIPARQPVLLRLPSGKLKSVELHPGKVVSLGKFGSFRAEDIIGLPYGLTYEIVSQRDENAQDPPGRKAKDAAASVGELKVVINRSLEELEATSATNEMINDDCESQTLTYLDIRALKEAGLQGREIVQREVESNSTFQQRTSWSQQKFVMRKESKHLQLFTPVAPSLTNVSSFHSERFERDSDKLRGLRADSLASLLSMAGVGPGGRYIVVDGVGGAVVGAMLERMGGEGRLLALNDADSPPSFDLMATIGLSAATVDPVLRTIHWACTERDWQSTLQPGEADEATTPAGKPANERDKQRFRKRRAQHSELERVRQDFFQGEFDGLVVACGYECVSIVDRLLPYLAGSSHIVVHHPFLQPLTEAHAQLRLYHSLIDVSITEPFQRKYQVLPGRMHPEMNTSSTAGYLLHAIRVYTEQETQAAIAQGRLEQVDEGERETKRRRVNAEEAERREEEQPTTVVGPGPGAAAGEEGHIELTHEEMQ